LPAAKFRTDVTEASLSADKTNNAAGMFESKSLGWVVHVLHHDLFNWAVGYVLWNGKRLPYALVEFNVA